MKLLIFNTITISSTGAGYTLYQISLEDFKKLPL